MELPQLDGETKCKLQKKLSWQYKFSAATMRAAKSSVTALRRQVAEEANHEAEQVFSFQFLGKQPVQKQKAESRKQKLNAADTGTAIHKFLQHFNFDGAENFNSLEAEAGRLEREKILSADERAVLDLKAVAAFWRSEVGRKIQQQAANVRRELAFTAKFSPAELSEIIGSKSAPDLADEFIVVQGVADLVVLLPQEIWLVDFKTDAVRAGDWQAKTRLYTPQLKLYASALVKIYSRPVTNCWLHFLPAQKTENVKN
jgi:ATP-dependent helicase/nuclease subunit A